MSARAAAESRAGPGRPACAVSALFEDPADVDRALARLTRMGVPRDLIDVVVSPEAAARFYPGRARPLGHEAVRYAGVGGLIGLIVGATVSLVIVLLPGFADPGLGAIVQLLGPNFATVTGAVIGAILGLFVRRRVERRYARAVQAPDSIVVVVTARTEEEAAAVARVLSDAGGVAARVEA